MKYNALIVGCGLTGSVIARELAEKGLKILLIDQRNHIGGNMYDYIDDNGILVQKYGPHTFHTKNETLFNYMMKYEEWVPYSLCCGAVINNKCTPTPFNFKTIDDFFEKDKADLIKSELKKYYPNQKTVTVLELLEHSSSEIKYFADFLWENDYSLYTAKQWGISSHTIDKSVLKRVPIRLSYDEGYFDDDYQVMPKHSFTEFFKNLHKHPNITVKLSQKHTDLVKIDFNTKEVRFLNDNSLCELFVYTGPIDELCNYKYGALPYRTLKFDFEKLARNDYQKYPVVAYPQDKEITRITEYTKLPIQESNFTVIAREYSYEYSKESKTDPYYPVITSDSQYILKKYQNEIASFGKMIVCGRLGKFKYYNMDQALKEALDICLSICKL